MIRPANPWINDDEKEHYPSVIEWWCTEGFISNSRTQKKWSYKGSFTEWCTKEDNHGSTYDFTLFDLEKKTHISQYIRNDKEKLDITYKNKNKILIHFNNSFFTGSYPNYSMHYENIDNQITLELQYKSEALPHWITQDITEGYLPMGLGFYRYGFIPKNSIEGTLTIADESYSINGTGYHEHVWGDFSYKAPLTNLSSLKKSIIIYKKLISWWIHNHKPHIPNTLKLLSENNYLGYDWIWGILDNGWSIFLGNILFWFAEGPIFGTLIITKNGKEYKEFCNVNYKYAKFKWSKHFDFTYPSSIEITTKNQNEKLHLIFEMIMPCREFMTPLNLRRWKAFVICEAPGRIHGSYEEGGKIQKLTGMCKIEPQRQVSIYGHNALSINILKPPKGVGIGVELDSHYLKKQVKTSIVFQPYPKCSFNMKRIKL